MKSKIAKIALALVSASLFAFSCAQREEVVAPKAPAVTFEIEDELVSILVGESVTFSAAVESNVEYSCGWFVDGRKMTGLSKLTYTFDKLGTYKVGFKVENEVGELSKEYTVVVSGEPLVVKYSIEDDIINVDVTQTISVSVSVTSGDKNTSHVWTLDGEIVSETNSVEKNITVPGTYILEYNGVNEDQMTATKTWTIFVQDLPLSVKFSVEDENVETMVGKDFTFTATPEAGLNGFAQTWSVDGVQKSTSNSLVVNFNAEGTHTVSYVATNSSADRIEKNWTVTVIPFQETAFVFDNFETDPDGSSAHFIGNTVNNEHIVKVVANPYKTSTNSSDKVLLDQGSLITWSSSAYFKFKISTFPDGTPISSDERAKYTKVRVMVYLGDSNYTPLLQEDAKSSKSLPSVINGVEFDTVNPTMDAWKAVVKTNDWNVFVYDLTSAKYSTDVNALSNAEQLQFRVCVDFKNNGLTPGDVYFDNIEFLE